MPKQAIEQALSDALQSVGVVDPRVHLEYPAELEHGDYASGAAMQYAKQIGMTPRALAEKLVATMGAIDVVEKTEIAGRGFINFHLAPAALAQSTEAALQEPWGRGDLLVGKKVMVEYTDPNPFKVFHIGHLMSNAIGEAISRLIQYTGAEVRRANYQGDVGQHVAKAVWAVQKFGMEPSNAEQLGNAYARGAEAYETDAQAKVDIDAINAKVYDRSDADINAIYDVGRKASLEHFEKIYKMLGTTFDHYFFESETAPRGVELVRAHPEVFEQSDGATVYKGEKVGLHTRVFLTSKSLPTYETKDLGLAELKNEIWPADVSISVTAHEQADYFKVILAAMKEFMPDIAAKIVHVSHGMMRFAEGKMSSRKGNVVTGESLLKDLIVVASERAKESRAEDHAKLAEQVAVAAIKYQILKQASGKDIIFDRERALSLEGDSGPYLQYAYARTHAVVEKAKAENITGEFDATIYGSKGPQEVARLLHRFPEIVAYAAGEPHLLVNYLLPLAAAFNSWYAQEQILDGTPEAAHKVAVTDAVRNTLKVGLWLLGIPAPEKM